MDKVESKNINVVVNSIYVHVQDIIDRGAYNNTVLETLTDVLIHLMNTDKLSNPDIVSMYKLISSRQRMLTRTLNWYYNDWYKVPKNKQKLIRTNWRKFVKLLIYDMEECGSKFRTYNLNRIMYNGGMLLDLVAEIITNNKKSLPLMYKLYSRRLIIENI